MTDKREIENKVHFLSAGKGKQWRTRGNVDGPGGENKQGVRTERNVHVFSLWL